MTIDVDNENHTVGLKNAAYFCSICYVYACNIHENNKIYRKLLKNNMWPTIEVKNLNNESIEIDMLKRFLNSKHILSKKSTSEITSYRCEFHMEKDNWKAPHADLSNTRISKIFRSLSIDNPCFASFLFNENPTSCHYFTLQQQPKVQSTIVSLDTLKGIHKKSYVYKNIPGMIKYTPCAHQGLCSMSETCSCRIKRGMCEKFCACREYCELQYPGCECKPGKACSSKSCKCVDNLRECDLDLCSCSRGISLYELKQRQENPKIPQRCHNLNMTLNKSKRLLVAQSGICKGYGLFAGEDIRKGEYICEYTGELISKEEGARRGVLNDISGCTYLFDLNKKTMIDAKIIGNKMRFANHAAYGAQNSVPRVMYINGLAKIGLYALKNIEAGDEIFFNYGMKTKLDWIVDYNKRYGVKLTEKLTELGI